MKKFYSASGEGEGLRPQPPGEGFAPCAPGLARYPRTSSLSPYIPGHLGLAGVVSHLRAYTRYIELYTQNCIKWLMQLGRTSLYTRAIGAYLPLVRKVILYALVA